MDEFDAQLNDPNQYDNPQDPANLSVVEHLRSLSIYGKLTVLYIVLVLLYLLVTCHWVREEMHFHWPRGSSYPPIVAPCHHKEPVLYRNFSLLFSWVHSSSWSPFVVVMVLRALEQH